MWPATGVGLLEYLGSRMRSPLLFPGNRKVKAGRALYSRLAETRQLLVSLLNYLGFKLGFRSLFA
jgi:hypothetical protein